MPRNLAAIVACQALVFVAVLLTFRRASAVRFTAADWTLALAIGAGFGVLMDLVVGASGVFAYLPAGGGAPAIAPQHLPLPLLLANALASYGIAALTVALAAGGFLARRPRPGRHRRALGIVVIAGAAAVAAAPPASLALLFAWGATLIAAGELALDLRGRTGPFLGLLAGRDWRPFARLWIFCAGIGLFYEAANLAFPFWDWLPGSSLPRVLVVPLVAALGYVALLHPIAVLFNLFRRDPPRLG